MNPTIITIIIATATFLLGIFGALQFYSSRMEKYIDAKVEALRAEIGSVRSEIRGEIGTLRAELAATREKVERIERQLDAMFKPIPPGRGD